MRRTTQILAAAILLAAAGCSKSTAPNATNPILNRDLTQMDRFGLPAIATVFIPTAQRDAYNQAGPAGDRANFQSFVEAQLQAFGHPNPPALASAVQPDIQPINTAQATTFLNGRRLQDDVITAELGLIFGSNAALNDDHVDANDVAFLVTFPYLAPPFTQ